MSQSSVEEQIKSAGLPVSKGTRMEHREDKLTKEKFGSDLWFSRWTRNVFANYPLVSKARGIRFLAECCKGLPAFVIGVGPSLDDEIKELKAVKRRGIIIAVDAAFRPLLANDIVPDLVVSFDCKDDQNRLWQDIPKGINVPGLLNSCTAPATLASWPGPVLFYNQYHTQDELCGRILPDILPELGQIPSCGTVGNMAILAAHAMGCDPICLVGFDFCLQPKGDGWRYRAQDYRYVTLTEAGVPPGWEPTEIKELYDNDERVSRSSPVLGDDKKEYKTDPELTFYFDSFKNIMPHFKAPIVNCTPNGMIPKLDESVVFDPAVGAYKTMTVAEAIKLYCKVEYQAGRTVLPFLGRIVPDPRRDLVGPA